MPISLVFEAHATTVDNAAGRSSGWLPGELTEQGEQQARELGRRRHDDGLSVVFSSDLVRAARTAQLAFGASMPVLLDWRLRECDYGDWNGAPRSVVHADRATYLDRPYPGGESWRQAVHRVGGVLRDLAERWDHRRVLLIGHQATRMALEHLVNGVPLDEACQLDDGWQPGWEYKLLPQ